MTGSTEPNSDDFGVHLRIQRGLDLERCTTGFFNNSPLYVPKRIDVVAGRWSRELGVYEYEGDSGDTPSADTLDMEVVRQSLLGGGC